MMAEDNDYGYEWPSLTGQVPVSGNTDPMSAGEPVEEPPPCPQHRETQHRDNQPKWCNRCGWTHGRPATPARKIGRANGGWGT